MPTPYPRRSEDSPADEALADGPARSWLADNRLVLAIVALHAAFASWLNAVLNMWADEYYSMHTTSGDLAYAVQQSIVFEGQPPLYFILLWFWRLVNETDVWARVPSTLFVCGFLLVTLRIVKRIIPAIHPAWVLAPLAFHPFTIEASTEMRPTGMTLFLSGVLVWLFIEGFLAERPNARATWAYALVAVAALYTQYFLGFLLLGNGLALLATRRRRVIAQYYGAMAAVGVCFLPMILFVPSQVHIHVVHNPDTQRIVFADMAYMIERTQRYVWATMPFGVSSRWRYLFPAALGLVLIASAICWRRRVTPTLPIFAAITGIVALSLSLVVARIGWENVVARHAIMLMLPATICVYAVFHLFDHTARRRILIGWTSIVLVSSCLALFSTYRTLSKPGDYKRAAAFIEANELPGQLIVIFPVPSAGPFNYYYNGVNDVVVLPEPEDYVDWNILDFIVHDESVIDAAIKSAGSSAETIWLVTSCGRISEYCGWFNVVWNLDAVESYFAKRYKVDFLAESHLTRISRCTLIGPRDEFWKSTDLRLSLSDTTTD